jgi:putative peptidoglycan lipid II flippase
MIPAAAAGLALLFALGGLAEGGFAVSSRTGALLSMAAIGGVMAVVYFGALLLLRNRDILSVLTAVRSRLGR